MDIITWNIQWGRGIDGRVDLARIVEHARALADFDVLCLQEVSAGYPDLPGCDGADQFHELAALLPGYTAIAGCATNIPRADGGRRAFGNMMLTRLPVRQVLRHLLPWPADPSVPSMQRMALEATLETPLGLLRLTTTHLEYYSAVQRMAQIERLRALHQEAVGHARGAAPAKDAEGPFAPQPRAASAILMGDFNMLPDSPEYARLLAPFEDGVTPPYLDAWRVAHPGTAHAPTVGVYDKKQWPEPSFAYDFMLVSQDLGVRIRGLLADQSSAASDHQALWLQLA